MVTHEAEKIWLSRDASVRPSVRPSVQKLHCACVSVCAACGLYAGQRAFNFFLILLTLFRPGFFLPPGTVGGGGGASEALHL